MDSVALGKRFLIVLCIAFVGLTALRINGSSVGMWTAILHEEETTGAHLYSLPREVRSDEWLVWTPSVVAQARHEPSFPIENPVLGAGRSPMLMNLPTRHYSTLFRPQLWGYFLFDLDHGFAWHWNVKIFGLLAAMFLLIRKLTGGSFWLAMLGSVWVFSSSYTQWWFSSPAMLPEMLASWALALWCVMKLGDLPRWQVALPVTAGLIVAAVNFALSLYPPYQIPMAYLGVAVLVCWFWMRRMEVVAPTRWLPAPGWLVAAGVAVAAVIVPFFWQLLPTLHLVGETSYPGARRATGGALNMARLFLGLGEPFFTAHAYPEKSENICSAANFYPVWVAAGCWLLAVSRRAGIEGRRWLWPLFGCLLVLTLFALCPLAPLFGRLTLLSFSTEERLILPIGIGGILLSVLVLHEMRASAEYPVPLRLILTVASAGLATAFLLAAAADSPKFFTSSRLGGVVVLSWLMLTLYLWPLKRAFAAVLLCAIIPTVLRSNPIVCGLAPLTESSAFRLIDEIRRSDPEARWLAFDGANQSAFLMAAGVDVLSGAKTLPDLEFYREIDPESRSLEIYNRYSLGIFHLAPEPAMVNFELFNFCSHRVTIHPSHPALRKRNVRYFVFRTPLENPEASGLQPFQRVPERHLWIYRFKETLYPAAAESRLMTEGVI